MFKKKGKQFTPHELWIYSWIQLHRDIEDNYTVDINAMWNYMRWYHDKVERQDFKMYVWSVLNGLMDKEAITMENGIVSLCSYDEGYHYIDEEKFVQCEDPYSYFVMCYIYIWNKIGDYYGTLDRGCYVSKTKWCQILGIGIDDVKEIFGQLSGRGLLWSIPGDEKKRKLTRYWTHDLVDERAILEYLATP